MPVRLSGKDIVKALRKDGWELERVTGSHHVMRHVDGRLVSVPVHGARPLPAGTLASIAGRSVAPRAICVTFFRAPQRPMSLALA
jgi:predicted RNA binding protein YcfA (HicA-like mRNA interferase family)